MRFWRSLVRFHGTIAFFGMIAVVFGLLAALAGEPSGVFTAGVGVGLLVLLRRADREAPTTIEPAWQAFAALMNGRIVMRSSGWRILAGRKEWVVVPLRGWPLTLDKYSVSSGTDAYSASSATYTRMKLACEARLSFEVCPAGTFTRVLRSLSRQDVKIGDPAFDSGFIVKSDDEKEVRRLFSSPNLRRQVEGVLTRGSLLSEGGGLTFLHEGIIRDVERLRAVHGLMEATLAQLVEMGATQGPIDNGVREN